MPTNFNDYVYNIISITHVIKRSNEMSSTHTSTLITTFSPDEAGSEPYI